MPEGPKRLLHPVSEAAYILGCGKDKVYQLVTDGVLAYVKFGGRMLIPASELERFVEEHKQVAS